MSTAVMNRHVREMVQRVRCRMCRARAGRVCVPYGSTDRTHAYRRDNPHRLRVLDATRDWS